MAHFESGFFKPENAYGISRQAGNVCFLKKLVRFKNTWYLDNVTADYRIAVAKYNPSEHDCVKLAEIRSFEYLKLNDESDRIFIKNSYLVIRRIL